MTQDNIEDTPQRHVLNGTGATRKTQPRAAFRENGALTRTRVTKIPKRIEALFITFADSRDNTGLLLTREELDLNPATRLLPSEEKDALVKHWPKFVENQNQAREIRKLREEEAALALEAHKKAHAIAKKDGFNGLTIPEQLKLTAKLYDQQIQKAALTLATTAIEDIHTDKLSMELYRLRVQYIKDFAWIREKVTDLAERIQADVSGTIQDEDTKNEALELLKAADQALIRKGVPLGN